MAVYTYRNKAATLTFVNGLNQYNIVCEIGRTIGIFIICSSLPSGLDLVIIYDEEHFIF